MTLFVTLITGIVLGSFLSLISSRNKIAMRSTGWNAAIPVLEAGVEEAMAHLNSGNPITANGWTATTLGGQPVHVKKRTMPDGGYFNVTIYDGLTSNPIIYSQGFMPSPLEKNKYISRLVKVSTAKPSSMWSQAISTSGKVHLANNTVVDGFDSTKGPYHVISNRVANGSIASGDKSTGAVDVNGAHVYGSVNTGAGGTVTVGGGAVGDVAWNATQQGIQPGWTNNNMNVAFPTNAPPTGSFLSPPAPVSGVTTLGNVSVKTTQLKMTGSEMIRVTGNAVLWVTGDISISGGASIVVDPGASLKLYVGGTAKLSGGGIVNLTGAAANSAIIGLSSNTEVYYAGGSDFYGTIHAPQADFGIGGNASYYGALIAKTYSANGGGSFHYDKSLATSSGMVMIFGWQEL